jgi:tRNA dimethylallyltransferase
MKKHKVVVIVGPTASGKTSLGIELAKRIHGEVVSADSRQVYRGLDLGSGKVTYEEMQGVPHHMLDVADPNMVYTVSDYVHAARSILEDVHRRGLTPIIVGGSFFYVDALLGRITLPTVPPNDALRVELDSLRTEDLFSYLKTRDPRRAETIDKHNRPRLIRALEITAELGAVPLPYSEPLYDARIFGITIDQTELKNNIHNRLISRIEKGMVDEVKHLHEQGLSYDRLESFGLEYRYIAEHLQGRLSYCVMLETIKTKSWQYAKRQMTWLKRDKEIVWVEPRDVEKIEEMARVFLHI